MNFLSIIVGFFLLFHCPLPWLVDRRMFRKFHLKNLGLPMPAFSAVLPVWCRSIAVLWSGVSWRDVVCGDGRWNWVWWGDRGGHTVPQPAVTAGREAGEPKISVWHSGEDRRAVLATSISHRHNTANSHQANTIRQYNDLARKVSEWQKI